MFPLLPSVTVPEGVKVLLVPEFLLSYVSIKFATSPVWIVPDVIAGIAAALVLPSYTLAFVAAVTVIGNLLITPVAAEAV